MPKPKNLTFATPYSDKAVWEFTMAERLSQDLQNQEKHARIQQGQKAMENFVALVKEGGLVGISLDMPHIPYYYADQNNPGYIIRLYNGTEETGVWDEGRNIWMAKKPV